MLKLQYIAYYTNIKNQRQSLNVGKFSEGMPYGGHILKTEDWMKCQVPGTVPILFFFFIYLQFISQKLDSQIRGDENNQKNIINIKIP